MRKIWFISCTVIVVFATSIAFVFFGRGNYELYLCKTREQSYSCKGCEKLEKITLKVIKEQNLIRFMPEEERGQLDGTFAHAVERVFGVLIRRGNGKVLKPGETLR